MKSSIGWRLSLILILSAVSAIYILPSTPLFSKLPEGLTRFLPKKPITLGLDLQGGMHLVLEVDGEKAIENAVEKTAVALKESLHEKKAVVGSIQREGKAIHLVTPAESEAAVTEALDLYPTLTVRQENGKRSLTLIESETKRVLETATSQTLETIRNRIDQFGVTEPLIQRQGENQILIQLPGVKDPKRAIELIGKTALLEFKLVDDDHPLSNMLSQDLDITEEQPFLSALQSQIPPDSQILFERVVDEKTKRVTRVPYLVKKEAVLTGAMLSDAHVAFGEFNDPYTAITFDPIGAELFERVTGENIEKRLAIVLDGTVYSAPVIQDKISGGSAQITGVFTTEQANDLAIVLRAGALPAPVNILQNVTVGPSLGQDSIDKGLRTSIVGALLVVIYMIFYYRLCGLLADFTLVLNLLFLMGALVALDATLTLPGIAAIVLTIGMAVDSNVLIYERIRDELKKGRPVRMAVNAGYDKAFSSIFDSHITTLITAFALFLFGTGPIKGFAVSLCLGVTINLFTSLVGTRVVFDIINQKWRLQRLSI